MDATSTSQLPSTEEASVGEITNKTIHAKIRESKKARVYTTFSPAERFEIGKYTAIHGAAAAIRKFKRSHPHLSLIESTARSFRAKYLKQKSKSTRQEINSATRGPKLMLGKMDVEVLKYLTTIRRKGGVVTGGIATAVAKAMISRSDCAMLQAIDIENTSWSRSLMQRAGWSRRKETTGKPPLPKGAVEEAGIIFHHRIAKLVEKYKIPPSMIINIDQTPMKYAPVANFTLNKRGEKDIAIKGIDYKKAITATFGITMKGKILPMQLIYGGKTLRSLPKFKFPTSFSLSVNAKHWSNTTETIKLIDEILTPYLDGERERLQLQPDHKALVVMDVFKGQTNDITYAHFAKNNIKVGPVPANMTSKYQMLDLTVNGPSKHFMKSKFSNWYASEVGKALDEGQALENIEVPLRLSGLKALHASWVVELYDYLSSDRGQEIIKNGWSAAGVTQAINGGADNLPTLDPFQDIDPMESHVDFENHQEYLTEERDYSTCFIVEGTQEEDDDDADDEYYEESVEDNERNVFSIFDDEVSDDE